MKAGVLMAMALTVCSTAQAAEKVAKETFGSGGKTRTYYLFVPDRAKEKGPHLSSSYSTALAETVSR
jgi:poly(3-hydroxybutyrate) depolymerase